MLVVLIISSSLIAALVGGVFFAFSVFVMRALFEEPVAQGVSAMQRINLTVINPLFLGAFLGAVPLLLASVIGAWVTERPHAFFWLAVAFVIYLLGSVSVTMAFNVPRNNKLAKLQPGTDEAAAYWPVYVREWLFWNHVRCLASLAAAAAAAVGLFWLGGVVN